MSISKKQVHGLICENFNAIVGDTFDIANYDLEKLQIYGVESAAGSGSIHVEISADGVNYYKSAEIIIHGTPPHNIHWLGEVISRHCRLYINSNLTDLTLYYSATTSS